MLRAHMAFSGLSRPAADPATLQLVTRNYAYRAVRRRTTHLASSMARHVTRTVPRSLWPMMRPEAVSGATRALRCRGWHE
eukprot:6113315-Prymnesium_polylepis.1